MTMHTRHFAGLASALTLILVLPGAAAAHVYPPSTDCTRIEGTAHLACIKQVDNMQRSGAHVPPLGIVSPTGSLANKSTGGPAATRAQLAGNKHGNPSLNAQ